MADQRDQEGRAARRHGKAASGGSRRRLLAAGALCAGILPTGLGAGQLRELSREATPLVLKDGRIAHVAIWAVPFRAGTSELDPEVKAGLGGLIETLATDCFLTAQAIGHVEPEAAKAGESLTAHRLARARADRIQQAMVERGLQASAIASVWDTGANFTSPVEPYWQTSRICWTLTSLSYVSWRGINAPQPGTRAGCLTRAATLLFTGNTA